MHACFHVEADFYYEWLHVEVGLVLCMLNNEMTCLHVKKNMLIGAIYLDIEDLYQT